MYETIILPESGSLTSVQLLLRTIYRTLDKIFFAEWYSWRTKTSDTLGEQIHSLYTSFTERKTFGIHWRLAEEILPSVKLSVKLDARQRDICSTHTRHCFNQAKTVIQSSLWCNRCVNKLSKVIFFKKL